MYTPNLTEAVIQTMTPWFVELVTDVRETERMDNKAAFITKKRKLPGGGVVLMAAIVEKWDMGEVVWLFVSHEPAQTLFDVQLPAEEQRKIVHEAINVLYVETAFAIQPERMVLAPASADLITRAVKEVLNNEALPARRKNANERGH